MKEQLTEALQTDAPILPFEHRVSIHCESGATSNLLHFYGLEVSEAMVFGLGSGLYFVYASFLKALDAPFTTFRHFPGTVFKNANKLLGVEIGYQTFSNKNKAAQTLDQKISENLPVGLLTDMYYLEYMPEIFRFHFAAHNLIVYGKENGKYHISDSIVEIPVKLESEKLLRARFGKGLLNPKGKMYWVKSIPKHIDLQTAIPKAIKLVCKRMLLTIMPWAGLVGIKNLAKKIAKYPQKGEEKASFLLLNIVRMQEVVGTGGSGFRNLYTAFLKEAAVIMQSKELATFAGRMEEIALEWRNFAMLATRCAKKRYVAEGVITYQQVSEKLHQLYLMEKQFFEDLNKLY